MNNDQNKQQRIKASALPISLVGVHAVSGLSMEYIMITEKRCGKCKKTKPIKEFSIDIYQKSGYRCRCKACISVYVKTCHRTEKGMATFRRYKQRYWKTERAKFHNRIGALVRYAVKADKLTKPNSCSLCHKQLKLCEIQGHHNDYSKPLEVIWLCYDCHQSKYTAI